jgi:hypothetical protein
LLASKLVNTTKIKVVFELGTGNRNVWSLKEAIVEKYYCEEQECLILHN